MSALAQRTKKLRFGPLVYLLPFYHPIRLIEEVCMLDQMSDGRFQLGVGRGVSPFETALLRARLPADTGIYHEAFQVLMKGLTSDELTFEGKNYNPSRTCRCCCGRCSVRIRRCGTASMSPTTPNGRRQTTSTF